MFYSTFFFSHLNIIMYNKLPDGYQGWSLCFQYTRAVTWDKRSYRPRQEWPSRKIKSSPQTFPHGSISIFYEMEAVSPFHHRTYTLSLHFLHFLHFQEWISNTCVCMWVQCIQATSPAPPSPQVHYIEAKYSKYTINVPQNDRNDCTCKHSQEGIKNGAILHSSLLSPAEPNDHS